MSLDLKEVCFMRFSPIKFCLFQKLYCYFFFFSFMFSNSYSLASSSISYQNDRTLRKTNINDTQKNNAIDTSREFQGVSSQRPYQNTTNTKKQYAPTQHTGRNSQLRFDKTQKSMRIQTLQTPIQSSSQQMRITNQNRETSTINKTNRLTDQPIYDEPKSLMGEIYNNQIDNIFSKIKGNRDSVESYNELDEIEKALDKKIKKIQELTTQSALRSDLKELLKIKTLIWMGKLATLELQRINNAEKSTCQDNDTSWSLSNIKNKVRCQWEQRKEKNLEKRVSSIIKSSQQELQKNRASIDSIPLNDYNQFLISYTGLDGRFGDYKSIMSDLEEVDCFDLPFVFKSISKLVESSLRQVNDNNYSRNWTRGRERIMHLVNQKGQECNSSQILSKRQKNELNRSRIRLDNFLKSANEFEVMSDDKLETSIKLLDAQFANEGFRQEDRISFHESANLARIELIRREEARKSFEESKPKNNFSFLSNLSNYLKLKFR